jgi:hypothetical protein
MSAYSRKQTCIGAGCVSDKCQQQTLCPEG